jgi:type II secretory pathway component PulK
VAERSQESGYALLAVLWVCVGITGLTLLVSAAARAAIGASHNRIALIEASWQAEACLAQAQAMVVSLAGGDSTRMGREAWSRLDETLRTATGPRTFSCRITIRAVGSRLDVNAGDAVILGRLLRELGMRPGQADSVAVRVQAGKPYANLRQLRLVPGLDSLAALDSVLDVEQGPVAINQAPAKVLALLPGFTPELADQVIEARRRHEPITNFADLNRGLSPDARDTLARGSARLMGTAVIDPASWILTIRSSKGRPAVTTVLEARVTAWNGRSSVGRRRSWVE